MLSCCSLDILECDIGIGKSIVGVEREDGLGNLEVLFCTDEDDEVVGEDLGRAATHHR